MAIVPYPSTPRRPDTPPEFSLVAGGPLYRLLRGVHLSGDALEFVRQRVLIILALTWVPLLALSIVEGQVLHGRASVPFLFDIEVHVRFLLALPLLVIAEFVVDQRMRPVVRQFLERELVTESARWRFEAAITSALRMRDSAIAEFALIAVVYLVGVMAFWRHYIALSGTATWYAVPAGAHMTLSLTGLWYAWGSLPVFQFLLVRWYYRIVIWVRFLWQVSRLDLRLVPTHPDRVCGLGFLANLAYAFTPLAVAHGAMLAGPIANRIFYLGAQLPDFTSEIGFLVLFVIALVFGPLLVFAPRLAAAKHTGLDEYGTLAERYVRQFDTKWLRGGVPSEERLMGSADIQSLADMTNSFEVVRTMRMVPTTRDGLVRLVAATAAPFAPLVLTMMSFEELITKLFGMLL